MVEDFFNCEVTVIRKGEKWSGVIPVGKLETGVHAEKISLAENVEWIFYLLTTTGYGDSAGFVSEIHRNRYSC